MLEERGIAVDDSGMDEEDLYGAVVRDGKYVPPALRKATPPKKMSPLNKLITSDLPKAGGANLSPIANLPTTRRDSSVEKTPEKVFCHCFICVCSNLCYIVSKAN